MYTELERSLENPKSVLRMFLQNCPESVESLLDDCVMTCISKDSFAKVILDFFLFCPEGSNGNEVATIDLVIATGKNKLIQHPIFETFIRLKWSKVWKLYTMTFMLLAFHLVVLIGYSLANFSHTFDGVDPIWKDWILWVTFFGTNTTLIALQLAKMHGILSGRCHKLSKSEEHYVSSWMERQERYYPMMDFISPLCGFFILYFESKELTVFLILYSSWQCMRSLRMFPKIGKNVFIASKVTRTIIEFFLAYLIEILAFTISFHILLPENHMFRYVAS